MCFNTSEEASRAVAEMNGKSLMDKTIYVALAQKKEDRRHQLEAQLTHHQRTSQIMHLQQVKVKKKMKMKMKMKILMSFLFFFWRRRGNI